MPTVGTQRGSRKMANACDRLVDEQGEMRKRVKERA